jgi:hypothetical protein
VRSGINAVVVAALAASCWLSLSAECLSPPPTCEALGRADLVFHGRVVSIDWVVPNSTAKGSRVTFAVIRAFKGVKGETFSGTFDAAGAEEFQFVAGMDVIVYARRERGVWATSCSRTLGQDPRTKLPSQAISGELAQLTACSPSRRTKG